MKRIVLSMLAAVCATGLVAETLCEGTSSDVPINLVHGCRLASDTEQIVYDPAWGDSDEVKVSVNGSLVFRDVCADVYEWDTTAEPCGTYSWRLVAGDVVYDATFEIHLALTPEAIDDIPDQFFTWQAVTPTVVVRDKSGNVLSAENYTLSYENNVTPGLATVIVTGKNLCSGVARKTFRIVSPISDALTEAFGGAAQVEVDEAVGVWCVTLTNDVTQTVTLSDAMGWVEIYLNGHTITGTPGEPGGRGGDAIRIAPCYGLSDERTWLDLWEVSWDGVYTHDAIVGGAGGIAVPGGSGGGPGGSGVTIDCSSQPDVVVHINEGVSVRGGDGGMPVPPDQAAGAGGRAIGDGESGTIVQQGRARDVYAVCFSGGAHGTVLLAESVKYVAHGEGAEAPAVIADEGWLFDGWDTAFDAVVAPLTVTATYRTDVISLAEALGTTNLVWTTEGDGLWEGHWTAKARDGRSAARSGDTPDGGSSVLAVTLEGAGTLAFDWRASCEARLDAVRLEVDGKIVGQLTGDSGWTNETVAVGVGTHVVRWVYHKSRSGQAHEDAVWLDNVVWTPTVPSASSSTLGEALNTDLTWTTSGDAPWEPYRTASAYEGGICAVSGPIGASGVSSLETTVKGSGRISFVWAVSCEAGYDWYEFSVDGKVVRAITGEEDWTNEDVALAEGEHVLRWEYWKDETDDSSLADGDFAFLDFVRWTPASGDSETELTQEQLSAFCQWLKDNRQLDGSGASSDARRLRSRSAQGKNVTLLEEYIAGTSPTNENSKFEARIVMNDGKPEVVWEPALNGEGVKEGIRTYRVLGTQSLDGTWEEVPEGKESAYRFFKVTVELP